MKSIRRLFASIDELFFCQRTAKYKYVNLQRNGYINKWAMTLLVKYKAIDKENIK